MTRIHKSPCFLGIHEISWSPQEQILEVGTETSEIYNHNFDRARTQDQAFKTQSVQIHFKTKETAYSISQAITDFLSTLKDLGPQRKTLVVREIPHEDWNRKWSEAFDGCDVEPYWSIRTSDSPRPRRDGTIALIINPSVGFGSGSHPTTALCLRQIGDWGNTLANSAFLDFGSGSGILAIAAAKRGAHVDAVEIDGMALENARDNAALNDLENPIQFFETIPETIPPRTYHFIVANILAVTLKSVAPTLAKRLTVGGKLALGGLLKNQADEVLDAYKQAFHSVGHTIRGSLRFQEDWALLVIEFAE